MARFICLAVLSLSFLSTSFAQSRSIKVLWADRGPEDGDRLINEEVITAFRQELQLRGISHDGPGLQLYLRAQSHYTSDGDILVVSVVETHGLGERIIQAGAKAQIFYAGSPVPENPEEARFVREYMTREVLSNQVQITNVEQLVFARNQLNRGISDYLDALNKKLDCMLPDSGCI